MNVNTFVNWDKKGEVIYQQIPKQVLMRVGAYQMIRDDKEGKFWFKFYKRNQKIMVELDHARDTYVVKLIRIGMAYEHGFMVLKELGDVYADQLGEVIENFCSAENE